MRATDANQIRDILVRRYISCVLSRSMLGHPAIILRTFRDQTNMLWVDHSVEIVVFCPSAVSAMSELRV